MHPIVGMAPAPVRPRPAGLLVALVRKPAAPINLHVDLEPELIEA